MKVVSSMVVLAFAAGASGSAFGYELGTHARISYAALTQSRPYTDPIFASVLGLPKGWSTNLGDHYIDAELTAQNVRTTWPFDVSNRKMPPRDGRLIRVDDYRNWPQGWLMAGAIREDDAGWGVQYLNHWIFDAELEPHDDPVGNFNRFCNHFFDPVNNRAYTQACFNDTFAAAPVWALGVTGPFTAPLTTYADPVRRNHFTVIDAREAMWEALTGLDKANHRVAVGESARLTRWATMFRALGDVLHLNQDMAQPQHTRDEGHGVGHSAWYEKYMDGRAKELTEIKYSFGLTTLEATNLQPLNYQGYAAPAFASFSDYWSTGLGPASATGKGLADYSSRGFFTHEKNFNNGAYASPPSVKSAYQRVTISGSGAYILSYLDRVVYDANTASNSRMIHMTTVSVIDEALAALASSQGENLDSAPVYALDRGTFDDRAELLIPRAVGYSAGLLNHFFRGKMNIEAPDEGVYAMVDHSVENSRDTGGFTMIKLKLANTTANEAMSRGVLVGVMRFHRDECYSADLSTLPGTSQNALLCRTVPEEITVSDPIDLPDGLGTAQTAFTFNFPEWLPINATDILLQVVYRGVLGTEADAVVVAAKDLSEPTYFTYHNATDYIHIGDKVYTRGEVNTGANESGSLLSQVFPQSCVDQSLSPPQLRPECFQPSDIRVSLATGTTPKQAVVPALPVRRFVRIAFLAGGKTSVLNQLDSSCFPRDPYTITNLRWQADADPYTGQQTLSYASYVTVRGIKGWVQASCVTGGDGSIGVDNRDTAMNDVTEKSPFPVQITPL